MMITKRYSLLTLVTFLMSMTVFGQAVYDRKNDPHHFTIFMTDGGWCWYQDPRVIALNNKLIIGGVSGNGSGGAYVGIYDLKKTKPLGKVLFQDNFDKDDHNSPVFFARSDGSILTFYARHGREKKHYDR